MVHWLKVTRAGRIQVGCGVERRALRERGDTATIVRSRVDCPECRQALEAREAQYGREAKEV